MLDEAGLGGANCSGLLHAEPAMYTKAIRNLRQMSHADRLPFAGRCISSEREYDDHR